jgi:hypothetical protein
LSERTAIAFAYRVLLVSSDRGMTWAEAGESDLRPFDPYRHFIRQIDVVPGGHILTRVAGGRQG